MVLMACIQRLHSNFPDLDIDDDFNITTMKRKLHDEGGSITDHFKAQYLWDRKVTGTYRTPLMNHLMSVIR